MVDFFWQSKKCRGSHLSDAGRSDEEENEAGGGHEERLPPPEQVRPLVHHGRHETLHVAKLRANNTLVHTSIRSKPSST